MNAVWLYVIIVVCFVSDAANNECVCGSRRNCSCLRCFRCTSTVSWEDCNQHIKQVACEEEDMICFTAHRIHREGEQQKHLFIKDCYYPEWCSAEECRKTESRNVDSSWCDAKCCDSSDFCNEGVTVTISKLSLLFCVTAGLVPFMLIKGLFSM